MMVNAPAEGWPPKTAEGPRGPVSDAELASWYETHFAFVWRTLRRFGVLETELEDAVQDVFLVAHRRRDEFERRSAPRTWLYAIARRIAADRRRTVGRRERREHAYATSQSLARGSLRSRKESDPETWIFLTSFLDELDEEVREAFVLFELEGLRAKEASELTGVNANTLYARRRRARQSFEDALAQTQLDEDLVRIAGREAPGADTRARVALLLPFAALLPSKAAAAAAAPSAVSLAPESLAELGEAGGGALHYGSASLGTKSLGWWAQLKVALASAGASALVVAGVSGAVHLGGETRTEAQPAAGEAATVGEPATAAHRPASQAEIEATTEAASAVAAPPTPVDLSASRPSDANATANANANANIRKQGDPQTDERTPTVDPIAEEVALHREGRDALGRGNAELALQRADAYLARFPRGRFVLPTRVLRVEALCAAGRRSEGRGARALLLRESLDAPTRAAVEALCE